MDRFAAEDRKTFRPDFRILIVAAAVTAAFVVLAARLGHLQMDEGDYYGAAAEETRTQVISLAGERGDILDANGVVLAANRASYEVRFTWDPDLRTAEGNAAYSAALRRVIEIVEGNGGTVIDDFAIVRENGVYRFRWDDGTLDDETLEKRMETWCANMAVSPRTYDTPEKIYTYLRERYGIPQDADEAEAHKLLSVWQAAQQSSYSSYLAQTVAKDVSIDTVAQIELEGASLAGISVAQGTTRVYPQSDLAAHVIGYTGVISDTELNDYLTAGYAREDEVGISGVEKTMEEYLTGASSEKRGSRTVEVNNLSRVIRELDYQSPTDGANVMLTLDSRLQKVAWDALEETIGQINAVQYARVQAYAGQYQQEIAKRGGQDIAYAATGSAVVMDVKTGSVLALVDYPSFDLNLFSGGISVEDYQMLLNDPRNPLFARSISSRATPGSIFKPCTATASLMEGAIDLDTVVVDIGAYHLHGIPASQSIHCWSAGHGSQNVIQAIQNSCNYFFYEAAYRLGNDKLCDWAATFGLTQKTAIEIPGEVAGQIASQATYYDPEKGLYEQATSIPVYIASRIRDYVRSVGETYAVTFDDDTLNAGIEKIITAYVEEGDVQAECRTVLTRDYGIPAAVVTDEGMTDHIVSLLGELRFNMVDGMMAGIGQSVTAVTPIGIARYLSALVNGGNVWEAHVVDRVIDDDGAVVYESDPTLVHTTNVTPEYADAVMQGMKQAILYGSVSGRFYGYDYRYQIAGKTGTAEVSDIDLENNSWFMCFAPYDDPQIAVVIYIPNGYSSSYSVEPGKKIVEYYLDQQKENAAQGIASSGAWQE